MSRNTFFFRSFSFLSALAAVLVLSQPSLVQAGCGCEKAPPAPAQVRPHATYAGQEVTIFDGALHVGHAYEVTFTSHTGDSAVVHTEAVLRRDLADAVQKAQLKVILPPLPLGPVSLVVRPAGQASVVLSADDTALTVVPQPISLPTEVGLTTMPDFHAAVGRDGTVYFSLDVSAIHMPRTFKAQAVGYPLRFTQDDIVFYNVQGFVMQLLEEGMPGLFAIDAATGSPDSDVLHYSRHEFNTHFLQHAERQSHAVDATDSNWHQDGTPHIDHDHLVVALAGFLADGSLPLPGATPAFDLTLHVASFFQHGLVGHTKVELQDDAQTDSYDLQGSTGSQGDVWSNGLLKASSGGFIDGNATALTFDINASDVSGDLLPLPAPLAFIPVDIPAGLEDLGNFTVSSGGQATLGPGSYQLSRLRVTSAGRLNIENTDGPVTLYVTGQNALQAVEVASGGEILIADANPEKFAVYVASGDVRITEAAAFSGVIYAPASRIHLDAEGDFSGSFVGDEIQASGAARIHYDTALRGSDPLNPGEETEHEPPTVDQVTITKAVYKNDKEKLRVYAVSDAAPTAHLTVSIDGFVEAAVMTYNANKARYEYKVSTSVNVDGAQVTVASALGGQASQTMQ